MTDALNPMPGPVPPGHARQCRAFLCVRDEADRLPYLLSYYRALGVDWFFVIDNASTDHTAAFLRSQPDCSGFWTGASFAQANYGINWINALIAKHGQGHWCLFVDADELLVYPHMEEVPLPALCEYLTRQGYQGLYAFLLDMYSDQPVSKTVCPPGMPFLDACPFFDRDYTFLTRPRLPFRAPPFPPFEVVGGPRLRRFYPEFRNAGPIGYMWPRGMTKLRQGRAGTAMGLHRLLPKRPSPPLLSKVPLIFGRPDATYVTNHRTTALRLAPVTGVLQHFKFLSDFHARVLALVREGQHFDGGSEYGRYAAVLRTEPCLSLRYPGTMRYGSSADLVRLDLMRTVPTFEAFHAAHGAQPKSAEHALLPASA